MKILIDENLDVRLRHLFPDYETYTVEYMGWKGLPNGELLSTADSAGFALLITGEHEHGPSAKPEQTVNTDIGN